MTEKRIRGDKPIDEINKKQITQKIKRKEQTESR